ncbi:MAG: GNAT family N-acetyltransferase [Lachnospiraceae bacterium]|nr:GNAT family N-acetyltransferase [Lachnospiraceae bacterium]
MLIREYQPSDCRQLAELFYNTVHRINVKDYTKEQLDVWATGQIDLEKWNRSFQEHFSLVALDDGIITGFGDIDRTGYLDRLYVHADYQARGVATHICDWLEQAVPGDIVTHASITARPFFEKRGYKAVKEQQVERQGILLTNYVMIKAGRQGCGIPLSERNRAAYGGSGGHGRGQGMPQAGHRPEPV